MLILALASFWLPLATPAHAAGSSGTTGLAAGDFDGDGHLDLAVGAPGEDVGPEGMEIDHGGQVSVIYGSNAGLNGNGNQVFTENTPGMDDEPEPQDSFGYSVAAGDFNGDGRDDLAIGVPGEGTGSDPSNDQATGAVHILFGRAGGLSTNGDQYRHQDSPGVKQVAEDFDFFGQSLTAGDFGKSAKDDLAVGAPSEDLGSGLVHVLFGSNGGPTAQGDQLWHQDSPGVKGVSGGSDNFGFALAAANFGRNGNDDLAIGVWRDSSGSIDSVLDAGAVNVLYGSPNGLTERGDQRWTQDSPGVKEDSQNFDAFGWALAAGNVGRSHFADLAVGAPFEDVGQPEVSAAGSVNVLYGGEQGLRARGDQFWTRLSPGIPGSLEIGANFGNTVAIGDVGKRGVADLAIGAPFQDVPVVNSEEGDVTVIYGRDRGLKARGSQSWTQDSPRVNDDAEGNDFLGASAAIGDFGKSKHKDLAIGAPGEDSFSGGVNVLYGRPTGLSAQGDQFWQQGLGIKGVAEPGDEFGTGRFD